jgi:uncharacterized protein (TIGR02145 family)
MSCSSTYCIKNTGLVGADDNYITGGTYNGLSYWTGQTSGWTIYYYTGVTSYWCLSDTLGGSCYLTGKYPCVSTCPDLSNIYVFSGICLTPTPTPTKNCDVLDFTALFDCDFIPTPTPTPSASVTPTPTITPSSTNFCSIIGIDASGYTYTPTPTPTPTVTPTQFYSNSFSRRLFYSNDIARNCDGSGFAVFSAITGQIICPGAMKWQDCYNGDFYYTNNVTGVFPGTLFETFSVYYATVGNNGVNESRCITYLGMDYDHGNINTINILNPISYGLYIDGACVFCQIASTPTPTPSFTPTMTKTPTMTPTMTKTPTQTPTSTIGLTPTTTPTMTPTTTPTMTPTTTPTMTSSNLPCFGYLYNFYAITGSTTQSITSSNDWEVPSKTDYDILLLSVSNDARALKLVDTTTYWNGFNTNATNSSGFSAIGSGLRSSIGFFNIKQSTLYKTRTPLDSTYDYHLVLGAASITATISFGSSRVNGGPVRLVKNTTTLTPGQTGIYVGNDGKVYNTICIGTQEWTTQDLRETLYRGTTSIPNVTDATSWLSQTTGAYCIYNNDLNLVGGCPVTYL